MLKRRAFQVKAVRRYRVAKYPSYQDPDPTRYPAPVPFPFSTKLVAAVASASLSASCAQGQAQENKSVKNPFTVAQSGLPHRSSPYGTGEPQRLEAELARRVIERVFKESGYRLQRDYPYEGDGVSFVAQGYDPQRRVGYLYGDWNNLDNDAFIHWHRQAAGQAAAALEAQLRVLEAQLGFLDRADENYLASAAKELDSTELHPQAQEALAITDPDARKKALRAVVEQHYRQRLAQAKARGEGTRREVPDQAQLEEKLRYVCRELAGEVEVARAISDPAKRRAAMLAILEKDARTRISLAEMRRLEERAVRDKEFIAVISGFDHRFTYYGADGGSELETARHIPDPAKREAAMRAMHERVSRRVLERLEQSVREYIAWARSQGAQ